MPFAPLTTVSTVKQFLRIPPTTTTDDALIQRLLYGVSQEFGSALNRNILTADYTETRNGSGTNTLLLANWPVTAVASVAVGGPAAPRRPLVESRDYIWTERAIQLLAGTFCRGVANVVIVYTAGYDVIPWDLADKCAKIAALRYRELERLGQKSKVLAGETVTFDTATFPDDVRDTLNNYRRVVPISAVVASR